MLKILFVYDNLSPIGGGSQKSLERWFLNIKKYFNHEVTARILASKPALNQLKNNSTPDLKLLIENAIPVGNSISLHKIYPYFSLSLHLDKKAEKEILDFSPEIIQLNEPSLIDFSP